ncbi:cytochrome c oxidase subunit II [Blastococcus sp. BMG 814]|uniref:cytochrome-c oxidase n=1 Tax=Blastococcus carthaginiensis TaxID=3050034 RepID=A0ABT9I7Y9_9ACTN|nr:cytochrome c oxidase subunit II [Blastococcus carthaginiensis]MDP5181669.1 cytochrome c oxidase subunit II [Blastococcus carthaginiensis]
MNGDSSGSLDPKGPRAESIADTWWLMLGLGVAVFVLFAVLLAIGLFRHRREGEAPPSERRWIVGGGVVLPVLVLVVVFGATIAAMRTLAEDAPPGALVIEVTGNQWYFEVAYPDAGVTTVDELHLPVGRPVEFHLTSADVIHGFWVPELGGKMDMLPDGVNVLVLQADEPGEWGAPCAEFCGLEHARMQVHVVAESPEDFAAWIESQQ